MCEEGWMQAADKMSALTWDKRPLKWKLKK